jgi:pimeloyl-ACP methyl ester carboxylesterase
LGAGEPDTAIGSGPVPRRETFTSSDGVEIVYWTWGEDSAAVPVVLHHGFVVNARANWEAPGVVDALLAAGRRVIAPDARGHGESEKPHDPAAYGEQRMARDLAELIDLVGAPQIDLVGYSMGAVVALLFAAEDKRVRRLVVGGVGSGIVECGGVDRRAVSNDSIVEALTAEDPETLDEPGARAFRRLADALGCDRQALVAQARSIHRSGVELAQIGVPTLLLAGEDDPLAIRPQVLAEALPYGELRLLAGEHMSALADSRFTTSIVEFLA